MTCKLSEIKGYSDVVPKVVEIVHEVNDCGSKREAFCLGIDCGKNQASMAMDKITISVDVEELAKLLHKTYCAIFMIPSEWEDLMDYRQEMFIDHSKSLSQNPQRFLKLSNGELL